ncbi:aminopeptidase P family protein [Oceaniglobus roseus]|uniref:aminopeptidase P family protein n=1 Tax=Oceaniglobus roseus TaxID=1737570 RepID=UPI000C7F6C74|nr:aminopeptidase P family protein [Kandeliimicrobium roseum]
MFQSFEASTSPDQGPPRLAALRQAMAAEGLDGFLVPRADAHQGEYVAPCDEKLAWLTGFTGSAGFCAVLKDIAGVFVDGRYRVQVRAQVADEFTPVNWPETKAGPWLAEHLPAGGRLGFDPWLHTAGEIETLRTALERSGVELVPSRNLVDAIWEDRPAPPQGRATVFPETVAGRSHGDKRAAMAEVLKGAGQTTAVLTLPDSVCWLLNIRGADLPKIPVVQCFALLGDDGAVSVFADPAKFEGLEDHLGAEVRIFPVAAFEGALSTLGGPVRVDKATAPLAVSRILEEAGVAIAWDADPCILAKARKTPAEIAATREAHLRDGAAMCAFLHWLDQQGEEIAERGKRVTETEVVRALEGFRRATNALKDISFDTIAGSGPNAAIVHYRVTTGTDRALQAGELMLVDSGGQYEDGTTDITRTIAIGQPTDEHRACYTRVLQGMIAVSRARWPKGLAGRDLDALARFPLWTAGLDYDHGTGHGVGVYLSVHEGPQRISRISDVPLEPGMILSNEPGYYREGAFGIRIENLVAVEEAAPIEGGDDRAMLAFRTLTFAPLDRRLIDTALLSPQERAWIDGYHAEVAERLKDRVGAEVRDWLLRATAPI